MTDEAIGDRPRNAQSGALPLMAAFRTVGHAHGACRSSTDIVTESLLSSQGHSAATSRRERHCHTRGVLPAIILFAAFSPSYSPHPTRYTPGRRHPNWYCTTSRCLCHSESCANHITKLPTIIHVASFSPHTRHVLRSIYSPRPTHYRARHTHDVGILEVPRSIERATQRSNAVGASGSAERPYRTKRDT
jgi:hypothetical protein